MRPLKKCLRCVISWIGKKSLYDVAFTKSFVETWLMGSAGLVALRCGRSRRPAIPTSNGELKTYIMFSLVCGG
ncbi:MAG: hypothetical protein ACE5KK_00230 [Candidatus Brocadiales bacterium]